MAERKMDNEEISVMVGDIFKGLRNLEKAMNARFDKLKEAVIGYIKLGSDMATGSVITTLRAI